MADEPSLLLLRFLAGELSDSGILVVATYRNVDPTVRDPLASTFSGRTGAGARDTPLQLDGLTENDVAAYVELTASESPRRNQSRSQCSRDRRNPLFIGEMVRLLAPDGAAPVSWTPRIPQGVREVIGGRMGRLSADCRRLLIWRPSWDESSR